MRARQAPITKRKAQYRLPLSPRAQARRAILPRKPATMTKHERQAIRARLYAASLAAALALLAAPVTVARAADPATSYTVTVECAAPSRVTMRLASFASHDDASAYADDVLQERADDYVRLCAPHDFEIIVSP